MLGVWLFCQFKRGSNFANDPSYLNVRGYVYRTHSVWNSRQWQCQIVINETDMHVPRNVVGRQVMLLRNERDWSQEKLASICQLAGWDVSRGVIARIEGGVRWVADFEVLILAAALRVPVPELYPKRNRAAFLQKK